MLKIAFAVVVGAGVGGLIGWKGRCTTGACPLTTNPYMGALFGGLIGGLLFIGRTTGPASAVSAAHDNQRTSNVIDLPSEASFDELVLKAKRPVLVDFWAPWCGPCRMQAPILEELAEDLAGRAMIVKVNIDEHPRLARRFGVSAIPTLMIFQKGQLRRRLFGVQTRSAMEAALT